MRSFAGLVNILSVGPISTSSPEVEERGRVRDARRLLQVVRDDDDRQLALQLVQQLFDLLRRDRIERARRLVEQQHFRLVRQRPRDAQPLLLAARQPERALAQPVLHFVPQRRAPQRRLDDRVEVRALANAVDARAVRHVVVDRLRERIPALEHHPDAPPQRHRIHARAVDVDVVETIAPS